MADTTPARRNEHGVSVIEALILLALLALAGSVAMAPLGSGLRHDLRRADAALAGAARLTGEDAFRRAVQAAVPDAEGILFTGEPASLVLTAYLERPTACAAQTGLVLMTFRIVEDSLGGALECTDGDRTASLLQWSAGQARLTYDDGRGDWRARSGMLDATSSQRAVRLVVTGPDAAVWTVAAERLPPAREAPRVRPDGGGDLDR